MASIRKLQNGKFRVQIYLGKDENGKRRFIFQRCNTVAECRKVEYDWKIKKALGLYPPNIYVGADRDGKLQEEG